MIALAAGRGISLPSLSAAGTAFAARTTGAYAHIRRQFNVPIGKFECVQEGLGNIAASTYMLDAARRLTCAALDEDHNSAVISAIMKAHSTYMMRDSINNAMDIHGGKTVIDGPANYLGNIYRAIPIGITVEGANILTRGLIIFGQGAIRCHPWLLKEIMSIEEPDRTQGLIGFDEAFWGHIGHSIITLFRAFSRGWTNGLTSPAPSNIPDAVRNYYKQLGRYSASFALLADAIFLTMGGGLKFREMISARLGDILSELYFLSAVLKRWEDEGRNEEDLPLVKYCMENGFSKIESRYAAVLKNMPNRLMSFLVRLITRPFGTGNRGPSDKVIKECADIILYPSETRDRLTAGLYSGKTGAVADLEKALDSVTATDPSREKLKNAKTDIETALKNGILTPLEAEALEKADRAVANIIAVDDFYIESDNKDI
jgi:acyl-CoA dehydrogenase